MALSARTSDFSGLPLGEGFITLSTSANNAYYVRDPAEANSAVQANKGQFARSGVNSTAPDGDFNDQSQRPT